MTGKSPVLRKTLPILLTLLFTLLGPARGLGQQLQSYLRVDSLKVGDTFNYGLVVKKDQDYDEIVFPDTTSFGDTFMLKSRKRFSVNDFTDSLAYQLQFFGTSDTTLPALPVYLIAGADTTTLYTNPSAIYFKSSLKGEKDEDFSPLKPIFDFAAAWWPWIVGVLALLLLAAAGWWAYKRWQERPEEEPQPEPEREPFIDPLKELYQNLDEIEKVTTFDEELDFKTYYSKLGDALRLYFERVYQIKALEMTSRELLHDLNRLAVVDTLIRPTASILREADMVKFAKFNPTVQQAREALKQARHFASEAGDTDRNRIERLRRQHEAREQEKLDRFYGRMDADEENEVEVEATEENEESRKEEEQA